MITTPNSIIKGVLTGLERFSSSESLSSPADFEVLSNGWIECTIQDGDSQKIQIEGSPAFDFRIGDAIEFKISSNSFKFINTITLESDELDIYILSEKIRDENNDEITSGSIFIRSLEQRTSIKDIDEGYYIIKPTNQKLVIRNSYIKPEVDISDLFARYPDAVNISRSDLAKIEESALKDIYQQLSGFDNYFDIVDEIDMNRLLLFKVICLIHMRSNETESNYCKAFASEIRKYRPKAKYDADEGTGEIISEVPKRKLSYGVRSL